MKIIFFFAISRSPSGFRRRALRARRARRAQRAARDVYTEGPRFSMPAGNHGAKAQNGAALDVIWTRFGAVWTRFQEPNRSNLRRQHTLRDIHCRRTFFL